MTGEFFLPHGIRGGCARTDKTTDHDGATVQGAHHVASKTPSDYAKWGIVSHRKLPPTMSSARSFGVIW